MKTYGWVILYIPWLFGEVVSLFFSFLSLLARFLNARGSCKHSPWSSKRAPLRPLRSEKEEWYRSPTFAGSKLSYATIAIIKIPHWQLYSLASDVEWPTHCKRITAGLPRQPATATTHSNYPTGQGAISFKRLTQNVFLRCISSESVAALRSSELQLSFEGAPLLNVKGAPARSHDGRMACRATVQFALSPVHSPTLCSYNLPIYVDSRMTV
jgi:hypothetical protein